MGSKSEREVGLRDRKWGQTVESEFHLLEMTSAIVFAGERTR